MLSVFVRIVYLSSVDVDVHLSIPSILPLTKIPLSLPSIPSILSLTLFSPSLSSPISSDCLVWPPLQLINFTFVPLRLQVLYVNIANLGWNTFLSVMANKAH